MSAVEMNLIFYFLAAARQTHTQKHTHRAAAQQTAKAAAAAKQRLRLTTQAAATEEAAATAAQFPFFFKFCLAIFKLLSCFLFFWYFSSTLPWLRLANS